MLWAIAICFFSVVNPLPHRGEELLGGEEEDRPEARLGPEARGGAQEAGQVTGASHLFGIPARGGAHSPRAFFIEIFSQAAGSFRQNRDLSVRIPFRSATTPTDERRERDAVCRQRFREPHRDGGIQRNAPEKSLP